ncbi:MAG: glutamine synthetase family protein [Lachnospiraceae bacterium]|nr:glutamine synthetase family protein [Lachnospiraceae bacterium]
MGKEMKREDVIAEVKNKDVEFIRLQFTDLLGNLKNMAITSSQLEKALDNKFMFDGYSIRGFSAIEKSDMVLHPDYSTFEIFPWRPQHGKVARMLCDVHTVDGQPFMGDSRFVLKTAIAKAAEAGYTLKVEPECEFFLFHTDENGQPTTVTHEQAGYLDIGPMDLGENARRDIVLTLEEMGFDVITSHHESAPAQHEVDFAMCEALKAADNIMTFKLVVRTIAKRHGLHATFMPKPRADVSGSGMHLKMALYRDGKNVFRDDADPSGISETGRFFVGGILKHLKGMAALTNPIVNSYKRLCDPFALLHVPHGREEECCIELRSPDSAANPYLALAALLTAGMEGIEEKILPPKAGRIETDRLPGSLEEAVTLMERDQLIKGILGRECAATYLAAKKAEAEEYNRQVTAWEISEYLNRV